MKRNVLTILLIVAVGTSWGKRVEETSRGIKANVAGTLIELEFYTPNTVRVTKAPIGGMRTTESYAVILKPERVPFRIKQNGDAVLVKTSQLDVMLSLTSGKITFSSKGTIQLQEGDFLLTAIDKGVDKDHFKARQSFELEADEPIYGIGMLQNGKLSQRGENRLMIQSNQEDYANFFQSIKGYGILWDNYSPIQLSDNPWTLESQVADCIDYILCSEGMPMV